MTNGNDIVDDISDNTVKSMQKFHRLKMSNALLSSIMSSTISFPFVMLQTEIVDVIFNKRHFCILLTVLMLV